MKDKRLWWLKGSEVSRILFSINYRQECEIDGNFERGDMEESDITCCIVEQLWAIKEEVA